MRQRRPIALEMVDGAAFWAMLDRAPDGCWIPRGYDTNDYHHMNVGGHLYTTHRIAYALVHGGVAQDLDVHHDCERRACCRPEHLRALTESAHKFLHRRSRWRFILYRPQTLTAPASHFGVVGFKSRLDAEGNAHTWQDIYPAFTVLALERYEPGPDGRPLRLWTPHTSDQLPAAAERQAS